MKPENGFEILFSAMKPKENVMEVVSTMSGFPPDQVTFVSCVLLCVPFGVFYRIILHPSRVSCTVRQLAGLAAGMLLAWLSFGWQVLIMLGVTALCYVLTLNVNPKIVHRCVFIVAMAILSAAHLYRQTTDYGSYVLDYTGPLMLITQKVIYVAYSVHDGQARDESDLNAEQRKEQLKQVPGILEYFSYIFHYSMLLIGPVCTYREYRDFISGTVFRTKDPQKEEPSPTKAVVDKFSSAVLCLLCLVLAGSRYPVTVNADVEFIANNSFVWRVVFSWLSIVVTRMRYYFAFKAGEAINNVCGLGFGGYDNQGQPRWDKMSNVNILKLEFPQNMKMLLDNWNISTALWLRRIVYDRVTNHRTLAVFILSAFWHGFYGGYYLTFITCQIMVEAARAARRTLRERFQKTRTLSRVYDVITCVVTTAFITYTTVPFVLLDSSKGLQYWRSMYYFGHIGSFLALLIFRSKSSSIRSQEKLVKSEDANKNGIISAGLQNESACPRSDRL